MPSAVESPDAIPEKRPPHEEMAQSIEVSSQAVLDEQAFHEHAHDQVRLREAEKSDGLADPGVVRVFRRDG
jgi:hypothetical protein